MREITKKDLFNLEEDADVLATAARYMQWAIQYVRENDKYSDNDINTDHKKMYYAEKYVDVVNAVNKLRERWEYLFEENNDD